MNLVHVEFYTYAWFVGMQYGMDLTLHATIDLNQPVKAQLIEEARSAEKINKHLKGKDIAGHVLTSIKPWYVDDSGKVIEVEF